MSVLTPVYNGEAYLAECMESVIAQTYRNWEYIIVNNCSTDRTLGIAVRYAHRDSRIRVVNNPTFVGAVRNHNIALTLMSPSSKYCKFLQADDLIFPTCLSDMVELFEAHPSVGIVTSYQLRDRWVHTDGLPYPGNVLPGREVIRKYLLEKERFWFGNMSAFLLRADLARSRRPFLNEDSLSAEVEIYFALLHAHDFGFVHQVLSLERVVEGALSSFCERYNYWTIAVLYLTRTYGRIYLTPDEYERCLKRTVNEYYRCQGRELFRAREKSFWLYHQNTMKKLGFSFSYLRLLKGAMTEATDYLLQPVKAAGRQVQYVCNSHAQLRSKIIPKR